MTDPEEQAMTEEHNPELITQIARDLFDGTRRQRMQFLQETEEQQPRAESIDLSRYAAGVSGSRAAMAMARAARSR